VSPEAAWCRSLVPDLPPETCCDDEMLSAAATRTLSPAKLAAALARMNEQTMSHVPTTGAAILTIDCSLGRIVTLGDIALWMSVSL